MDVNGDGFDDFIVGAPDASPGGLAQAGSAYIYSGANGSLIYRIDGPAAGDGFGASVSMAGDVDSDGFGDFIVGAPIVCLCLLRDDPGSAYVFSGADASLIYRVDGTAANDRFGTSVSIAGDVDGDGVPDFVVGAPASRVSFFFGAGSAYVFSGANGGLIYRKNGPALGFGLGRSVSGAGDVDSDGFDDFIAGASGADPDGLTDAGSAFVYSGADGSVIHRIDGATSGDLLGLSVSGAGDVDGDGLSDFIIGATFADPGGRSDAGSAYVHSGADGLLIHQVDGDGFADFVVGAPGWGFIAAADPGSASVFSAADGSLIHQVIGEAGDDELGSSASRAGDVDGDGFPDFVVGARKADP